MAPQLSGSARLTVGGDTFVPIVLGAGASVSGRVVFDGTSPIPPIANSDDRRLSISFSPADGICQVGRVFFGPDSTFAVDGLVGTCEHASDRRNRRVDREGGQERELSLRLLK